jgi:NAD(P)-dependent dehydrogenase (short-subunit alcohol dehydrogenase family)
VFGKTLPRRQFALHCFTMAEDIAIVTGGSRGIGAATALHLAQNGFSVCVNYVTNKEAAARVVSNIEAAKKVSSLFARGIINLTPFPSLTPSGRAARVQNGCAVLSNAALRAAEVRIALR